MKSGNQKNLSLYAVLAVTVFLNVSLWVYSSRHYVQWPNVPEAPNNFSMSASFLGDDMMAYRSWGLALQNFGSIGEAQALKNYDYARLGRWFFILDKLDPYSNFVPYLAAYYFSSTQNPEQLGPLVKYLEKVGASDGPGKWRWMAEAAHTARHRMNNKTEALRISRHLGSLWKPGMPNWTQNMEPMLMAEMGDKDAAYLLMLEILKSTGEQMSASEYVSTVTLICTVILTEKQAATNPLCEK